MEWLNWGSADTTTALPPKLVRKMGPYLQQHKITNIKDKDVLSTIFINSRKFSVCYDLYEIRHCMSNESSKSIHKKFYDRVLEYG